MTDPTPTPGDDLAAVLAQAWHPAEATWLLTELDRLHEIEAAMVDSDRAGDRLGAAVASARAADPRGGR